jgi:hypothetical protein
VWFVVSVQFGVGELFLIAISIDLDMDSVSIDFDLSESVGVVGSVVCYIALPSGQMSARSSETISGKEQT